MNAIVRQTFDGEILAPGDGARVVVRPSVLRVARHEHVAAPGMTLAEIVDAFARPVTGTARLRVLMRGEPIAPALWPRVRPKPGVEVVVVGVPAKDSIGSVLAAVVAVVALVVAPYLAAPLIGALGLTAGGIAATAITGLIGAGLTIAGSLAVNALFPTARPQLDRLSGSGDTLERSQTFTIGGARNEARPYGAIPVVLGRHRMAPALGAPPYTEIVGDDQYLRMLFVWGYGPIALSDFRIGETPISEFAGVEVQDVETLTDGSQITLYPATIFEEQIQVSLALQDAKTVRTSAPNVDEVSVDVTFPNGVYRFLKSDARRVQHVVGIFVDYRAVGASTWIRAGEIRVTGDEPSTLRRTLYIYPLPRGQYEVQVYRHTPLDTSDDTVGEDAVWTAIRSRRNEAPIVPDKPLTVTALRIKASEELSGVVNSFNGIAESKTLVWSGSAWNPGQKSSNPADLFRHVLQGPGNARPVTDAEIDLDGLQAWHAYCAAEGFTFDQVRDFSASVYDTLRDIAAAGRAAVATRDGKWSVVWDAGATDIVQHFTPRNSSGFSAVRGFVDMPHAWRVRFVNAENNWLQDERMVYDDGYSVANATKFEGIEFPGVTDPDLVWRHGRYHIAQLRLRRETYELDTDFEHLVATRGDRVRVQHDVTLWGLAAGRVKAADGVAHAAGIQSVTLDEALPLESGKTYTLRFRLADGTALERLVSGVADEPVSVFLDGIGEMPEPGDLWMLGEQGLDSVVLRVQAVTARPDFGARLVLVDDAPGIADADTGAIPPFTTGIAQPVDFRSLTVAPISATETLVQGVGTVQSRVRVVITPPTQGTVASYAVRHRRAGAVDWTVVSASGGATFVDLLDLSEGLHEIEARALLTAGVSTAWTRTTVAVGLLYATPADVGGFRIAVNGDVATLAWTPDPSVLVRGYEIRFSPLTDSTIAWTAAAPLVTTDRTGTVQVAARAGTYLVKAVSAANRYSAAAARVVNRVSALTNFNVVETLTEHPGWTGSKTAVAVSESGALQLVSTEDVFARDDVFAVPDVFYPDGGVSSAGVYIFSDIIDLGEIYTSLVTVSLDAIGVNLLDDVFARPDVFGVPDVFASDPDFWSAAVDVSTTDVDPALAEWSDWAEIGAANLRARALRFRLRLATLFRDVSPSVRALTVTVDMPDRVVAGDDLAVSTSGLRVSFTPPFRSLQGLGIAAQDLATGDYHEITSKGPTGFDIVFKDAAGNPVARSFDYVAKGYGRVAT